MTELLVLDLVRKNLVTKKIVLTISYDWTSLKVVVLGDTWKDCVYSVAGTGEIYDGKVTLNYYGKPHPKHAQGTGNLEKWSNSTRRIMNTMMELYDAIVDPRLLIRRVNIAAVNLIDEDEIPEELPKGIIQEQISLFDDMNLDTEAEKQSREKKAAEQKERRIQKATPAMQAKYGKNAILKGTNFMEGATTRERNMQIGGHRSGEDDEAE